MIQRTNPSLVDALNAASDTRSLEIGVDILDRVPAVFRDAFGNRLAVIVADEKTFAVAGEAIHAAFSASRHETREPFVFRDPRLYAEHRFVAELEGDLRRHAAIPVAVGSGTINDLTKLAAHRSGRAYLCVATAASMDGYTAFGASITRDGLKQTFDCPAPAAVVADLNVIRNAPGDMNAWGYADLLAKVTAGADWMVAEAVGAEAIDPYAWSVVQGRLSELVSDAEGVRARDSSALHGLVEGLMLSGFAMQSAKSSRPASGAEHQFSHLWDMQHRTHLGCAPSHGFKVGIGTLAVGALYERLFELPIEMLDVDRCCANWPDENSWSEWVRGLHGDGNVVDGSLKEMRAKQCGPDELREQLKTLREVWPDLRVRLRNQLYPLSTLKRMLRAAGAPANPEEIGITRPCLRDSYWGAFSLRRRFTVLDLAVRAGVLEDCLARIFGVGGAWPSAPGEATPGVHAGRRAMRSPGARASRP